MSLCTCLWHAHAWGGYLDYAIWCQETHLNCEQARHPELYKMESELSMKVFNCLSLGLSIYVSITISLSGPPFGFLYAFLRYKNFPLWISDKIKLQNFRYRHKNTNGAVAAVHVFISILSWGSYARLSVMGLSEEFTPFVLWREFAVKRRW